MDFRLLQNFPGSAGVARLIPGSSLLHGLLHVIPGMPGILRECRECSGNTGNAPGMPGLPGFARVCPGVPGFARKTQNPRLGGCGALMGPCLLPWPRNELKDTTFQMCLKSDPKKTRVGWHRAGAALRAAPGRGSYRQRAIAHRANARPPNQARRRKR